MEYVAVRCRNRVDERLGILGDVTAGVLEQRHFAIDAERLDRRFDGFFYGVGIFSRHDAHVDENIAERIGPAYPAAATNFDDLHFGNDRAAGKFKGLAFFVGDGPFFDGANYRRGFDKGIGIFLDGISPLQTRRINFSPLHPNLEPSPPHSA